MADEIKTETEAKGHTRTEDPRIAAIVAVLKDRGVTTDRDWRFKKYTAQGEKAIVPETGKPFEAEAGHRVRGKYPALWVVAADILGGASLEESIRSAYQAQGLLIAVKKANPESTTVEHPCVPLVAVLGRLNHELRLANDPAYARAIAGQDEVQPCCLNKAEGCVGEAPLKDLFGFNLGALHGAKRERPGTETARRAEMLIAIALSGEKGTQKFFCGPCNEWLQGLYIDNVSVRARTVRERVFRKEGEREQVAAQGAAVESELEALMAEQGVTVKVFNREQYRQDIGAGDGRGGRNDRGRGDGRGRGRNDDQRGRRNRGDWNR